MRPIRLEGYGVYEGIPNKNTYLGGIDSKGSISLVFEHPHRKKNQKIVKFSSETGLPLDNPGSSGYKIPDEVLADMVRNQIKFENLDKIIIDRMVEDSIMTKTKIGIKIPKPKQQITLARHEFEASKITHGSSGSRMNNPITVNIKDNILHMIAPYAVEDPHTKEIFQQVPTVLGPYLIYQLDRKACEYLAYKAFPIMWTKLDGGRTGGGVKRALRRLYVEFSSHYGFTEDPPYMKVEEAQAQKRPPGRPRKHPRPAVPEFFSADAEGPGALSSLQEKPGVKLKLKKKHG